MTATECDPPHPAPAPPQPMPRLRGRVPRPPRPQGVVMETGQAFVIMQIGNPGLDRVYERAMVPALRACGLVPRRVDQHNAGGLLHSEIIAFIETSDLIVA